MKICSSKVEGGSAWACIVELARAYTMMGGGGGLSPKKPTSSPERSTRIAPKGSLQQLPKVETEDPTS